MRKETKKNAVWMIEGDDLDSFEYICPKCGGPAPYNYDGEQIASRFCPSCGIRLDEPEDWRMLVMPGPDGLTNDDTHEEIKRQLKGRVNEDARAD